MSESREPVRVQGFLRVNRSVKIPLSEIELRVSRSSGPGGQHANKTESRVEAVFEVDSSDALGPNQKRRIIGRLGPVLRAVAQDERSQSRNRDLALERLGVRLAAGLLVQKRRTATKPTPAAREKRLERKRHRGEVKSARRRPEDDD